MSVTGALLAAGEEVVTTGVNSTTVALIAAGGSIAVAVIGLLGTRAWRRRTEPATSVPIDLLALHDRLTVIEQIVHDVRHDMTAIRSELTAIRSQVEPLAATSKADYDATIARLNRIEDRLWPRRTT